MTPINESINDTAKRQVVITRVLNAPRDLVFQAFTDPMHLGRWYAPVGCSLHIVSFDAREGGSFHTCIRSTQHHDCWCKGIFLEVVKPSRLVYTMAIADADGNLVSPTDAGMDPEWPAETVVTVTFEEHDGGTKVTLHQTALESVDKRTGAYPSWLQMFDKLEEELKYIQ